MIEFTMNGQSISVKPGTTLLSAARTLNVNIPTLCHVDGLEPFTSCMVCLVQDMRSGKLLPSCSMPAQNDMVIETDNDTIRTARRNALELLMSEHSGDCEAPCHKGCPASMNIPLMLRQIASGDMTGAIQTVKQDIALPAVMGRICSAPCEKVCNRSRLDNPVNICLLKRYAADEDLKGNTWLPECQPESGKSVAVVGAGPCGLSAAYYLRLAGHAVTIYDRNEHPGGNLRYAVDQATLPHAVLDQEIAVIMDLGVKLESGIEIGEQKSITELKKEHDAVVLATGVIDATTAKRFGVTCTDKGIRTDNATLQTSEPGIYAGGSALRESKMAIRSAAHGKKIAESIHYQFTGQIIPESPERYDSRTGKLGSEELNELMKNADAGESEYPKGFPDQGYNAKSAQKQAARCMHCDCRKPVDCKLRSYAREYKADPKKYSGYTRTPVELHDQHSHVIYEPGKCIKCGICVRITEKERENLGLTFIGRGFDVRVQSPFDTSLDQALAKTATACATACPTGALALKEGKA